MTPCDAMESRLDAWLDGELSAAEQVELASHLEDCVSCQRAHRELQQTKAALGRFFHQLQQEAPAAPARRLPGWLDPALAAAAMVVLVFLVRGRRENPLEDLAARLAHAAVAVRDHGSLRVTGSGSGVLRIECGGDRLYWEQRAAAEGPVQLAGGFDATELWTYEADRQEVIFVEITRLAEDHPEFRRWPAPVWSCRQLLERLAGSDFAFAHVDVRDGGGRVEVALSPGSGARERGRMGSATLLGETLASLSGSSLVGGNPWEAIVRDATPGDARAFGWRERFPDARSQVLSAEELEEMRALGYVDDG